MNNVVLIGNITRDIELRTGKTELASFTLAVQRRFKQDGEYKSDFISCKCFGKTAEFVSKYFGKGSKIALTGNIQTGRYEKDGTTIYTTEVIVDNVEFVEKKQESDPFDI